MGQIVDFTFSGKTVRHICLKAGTALCRQNPSVLPRAIFLNNNVVIIYV